MPVLYQLMKYKLIFISIFIFNVRILRNFHIWFNNRQGVFTRLKKKCEIFAEICQNQHIIDIITLDLVTLIHNFMFTNKRNIFPVKNLRNLSLGLRTCKEKWFDEGFIRKKNFQDHDFFRILKFPALFSVLNRWEKGREI